MGKFSYSKVETYEGCPFKYKLQYEDENYVYVGSIATEFGTAIHETEEAIAKAIQEGKDIDYIEIKKEFISKVIAIKEKYPVDYLADDGKSGRNYEDKATEYLGKGIYRLERFMKENPTYQIVGIEQKFEFDYDEEHKFTGAIDRVFYDRLTGRYIIQDIKTYAVPIREQNLVTPLQFVVYTWAAKSLWNCEPYQISCQYDLPLVGITQDAGTKGYIDRGRKKIESLFEGIAKKNWEPKPSQLCHWCNYCKTNENAPEPYKYMCPYFMKWTRENKTYDKENMWMGIEIHPQILESYHTKHGIKIEEKHEENEG